LTIKKGQRVTFLNKDATPHTVTPDAQGFMGTGRLTNNESKTVVFKTVGAQTFHCDIHPSMTGKIVVVK
jgi:plastocyanin